MRKSCFAAAAGISLFALASVAAAQSGPGEALVAECASAKLVLDDRGCVTTFCRRGGGSLLANQKDVPFMSVRIGPKWHNTNALAVSGEGRQRQLDLRFEGGPATARAVLRTHDDYFEIDTVALEGADVGAVEEWRFANVPVNLRANVGTWLNVAWDEQFAVALIALEDKTDARGGVQLQAVAHRGLGFTGRKAALIACPTPRLLEVVRDVERAHGLPSPTMTAARPDDIELVCARSLGYDAAIGGGFAACYGGPSNVDTFSRNGRRDEIAGVVRTYDRLRMEDYFPEEVRRLLCEQGSEWGLLPPEAAGQRYRLVPARYEKSAIVRPGAAWQVQNDVGPQPLCLRVEALPAVAAYGAADNVVVTDFAQLAFTTGGNAAAKTAIRLTGETHPQAGAVARLSCTGPAPSAPLPAKLAGHGQPAWAQASATFPAKLNLSRHRSLGVWVKGDGSNATLNVQLERTPQSYLHFYQPITFAGWRYCELGEPEGDRVIDYFTYEKYALHDLPLDSFVGLTLMILNPPHGRDVELEIGRIEALSETGGRLVDPRVTLGQATLELPVTLEPEQYLETGDWWGAVDPALCRIFSADGNELRRVKLEAPPVVPTGCSAVRLEAAGQPPARAKVTVMLRGQ